MLKICGLCEIYPGNCSCYSVHSSECNKHRDTALSTGNTKASKLAHPGWRQGERICVTITQVDTLITVLKRGLRICLKRWFNFSGQCWCLHVSAFVFWHPGNNFQLLQCSMVYLTNTAASAAPDWPATYTFSQNIIWIIHIPLSVFIPIKSPMSQASTVHISLYITAI